MLQFWGYWLPFGLARLLIVAGLLGGFSRLASNSRQWRWVFICLMGLVFAIGDGFLAFGLSYQIRGDGLHILYGRWWILVLAVPLFVLTVIDGMTVLLWNNIALAAGGFVAAGALVGLSYTPTNGGADSPGPLYFFFIASVLIILAIGFVSLVIAMDWQFLWFARVERKVLEGRARVQSKAGYGILVVVMTVSLLLWPLFAALGPEGWNKWSKDADKAEDIQIWLTGILASGMMIITAIVAYIFFDPSGDTHILKAFNLFSSAEEEEALSGIKSTITPDTDDTFSLDAVMPTQQRLAAPITNAAAVKIQGKVPVL